MYPSWRFVTSMTRAMTTPAVYRSAAQSNPIVILTNTDQVIGSHWVTVIVHFTQDREEGNPVIKRIGSSQIIMGSWRFG